jgi:tripartite ATP-independent transporter DctP family solute receptor
MKVKQVGISLIAAAVIVGLTGCGSTSSSQTSGSKDTAAKDGGSKVVLKLADIQPANYPTVAGDNAFAKEVNEKTNGRIQIKVYPNAQLGDEKSAIEQIQLGAIDFGRINTAPLAEYSKDIGVFNMPYLFGDSDQMWKVLNGPIGDKLLKSLEGSKMEGLTYYDSGSRNFYNSKHSVVHPADLKGLKIRVQQSKTFVDLVNGFGASATPMNFGDVYNALQTGVLDGAENNWPSYFSTNHYKVAKYITEDQHTRNPEMLLASQSSWNKLSPEDQKVVKQAAIDSQAVERQAWTDLEKKAKDAAKANGNVITSIQNVAEWQDAVKSIYDTDGKDYKDLISQIQAVK